MQPFFTNYPLLHTFSVSFRVRISTRIISSPICFTSQKGITYSFSLPNIPQRHPGPGIIRWVIQPVFSSNSTSPTKPRRLQSQIFITSFFLNQKYASAHTLFLLRIFYDGSALVFPVLFS